HHLAGDSERSSRPFARPPGKLVAVTPPVQLDKYQALGNDFLVLVDADGTHPVDDAFVRRVCDRHRGVGADGLIRVTRATGAADLVMELRNADGGRAEMSGN